MFTFFRRTKSRRKSSRLQARFCRPQLEQFEHRLAPAVIQAISVGDPALGGGLGNAGSSSAFFATSPNGRYVAFASDASNLVPGDTNGATDVFVRDTLLGTTTRVSTDSAGNQGNYPSQFPALAVDGGGTVFVAFQSSATNLVSGGSPGGLFVKNLGTGITTCVSTDSAGNFGNNSSYQPALAFDHNGTGYVAFTSLATNLVSGDTNNGYDVFVKNLTTGVTTRVSTNSAGNEGNSPESGYMGAIAVDGSGNVLVAFFGYASNLVSGDTNATEDVFVKNLTTGVTTRVSTDSAGNQGNGPSELPALAVDGSGTVYVSFDSNASNLVSGDTNVTVDVFVKNLTTGITTRVSTDSAGNEGNDTSGFAAPAVDRSGSLFVAFQSNATNLVSGATYGTRQIFLKNMSTGIIARVSSDVAGNPANSDCTFPSLAIDGTGVSYVTFYSYASNLVSGDTNATTDVFLWSSSCSGTSVFIGFDDLPVGTVVTTQYPEATFSSADGYGNVTSDQFGGHPPSSAPYTLGTYDPGPFPPYTGSFNDATYVDFPKAVCNLNFLALGDNDTGQIGSVKVFTNGTLTGTVPIVGDGDVFTPVVVDLGVYEEVTRIEIGPNTDAAGLVFDDFQFTVPAPPPTLPDIAMHVAQLLAGNMVQFTYETTNNPGTFELGIYRSADAIFDTGDVVFGSLQTIIPSPSGGEQIAIVSLPSEMPIDPARKYVLAVADPRGLVSESDESNNDDAHFRKLALGVVTHGYEITGVMPTWVNQMAQRLKLDGYDRTIPFDWADMSNDPIPGQAVIAGLNLATEIRGTAREMATESNDVVDLRLIGHSRGAVVITQAVLSLAMFDPGPPQLKLGFVELTMLDPHPAQNRGSLALGLRELLNGRFSCSKTGHEIHLSSYRATWIRPKCSISDFRGSKQIAFMS